LAQRFNWDIWVKKAHFILLAPKTELPDAHLPNYEAAVYAFGVF